MQKIRTMFQEIPSATLQAAYQFVVEHARDIREHCPTLVDYAKRCKHVTEMGTRWGASTLAFLYAQPQHLVCYDWKRQANVGHIEKLAGDTTFTFHKCSTLEVTIEPTDLLFLDTLHTYTQLKAELALHSDKAKKYIIMHDTVKFGKKGQRKGERGLEPAWTEFLKTNDHWELHEHYTNNNGLTILSRVEEKK
jgi:hypothetical protein